MEDERRTILSKVASGAISPEEGAALLDAQATPGQVRTDTPSAQPARKIRVARALGVVTVIGDPSVREAVAEGPHTARHEGDTLVIEGHVVEDDEGAFFFAQQRVRIRVGGHDLNRLTVRVNPELPLEIAVQAGSVRIGGIRGGLKADVQAGSMNIDSFEGPLDLTVQAGSVKASGLLASGQSKVRCEAGSVGLHLLQGSSVRVTARSNLGKVSVQGAQQEGPGWGIGAAQEAVIGGGAGSLDINAVMGAVKVTAE